MNEGGWTEPSINEIKFPLEVGELVIPFSDLRPEVQEQLLAALNSRTVTRPRRESLTEPVDPDSLDS